MSTHNFRNLTIWNKSVTLTTEIYKSLEQFPTTERYNLSSQISRAAVSIPANIAEGSAKSSNKDFIRFLQISLGSLYELETEIIVAHNLNYIDEKRYNFFNQEIISLEKMVNTFIVKLKNDENQTQS